MIISLIVAYTSDRLGRSIIGKDNALPWKIQGDMAWFKECTWGSAIVMGRKTHEAIGRVLPGRTNIIVSRDPDYRVEGAYVFSDLHAALEFASRDCWEVFVIGGAEIYKQTIRLADRVYLTYIAKNPGYTGDTFFPSWDRSKFKVIHREEKQDPKNGKIVFKIYQRDIYDKARPLDNEAEETYPSEGDRSGSGI